jgi:hypothetical protein
MQLEWRPSNPYRQLSEKLEPSPDMKEYLVDRFGLQVFI